MDIKFYLYNKTNGWLETTPYYTYKQAEEALGYRFAGNTNEEFLIVHKIEE